MPKFNIAGINIEVSSPDRNSFDNISIFSSPSYEHTDLNIDIKKCDYINKPQGKMLMDDEFKWLYKSEGTRRTSVYICGTKDDEVLSLLETNDTWSDACITFLKGNIGSEYTVTGSLGEILFRNNIIFHDGLVIHASAIRRKDKGIIFSAPAGTGKSTQANLWKTYMGATVINGDRPAVRTINGSPYVYGTPWSGSSPEFENCRVPLSAIIILEQAPYNSIEKLSKDKAVLRLLPRCFLPYYNGNLMNIAVNNLEKVIAGTSVYLLKCTPEKEAVELVACTIDL